MFCLIRFKELNEPYVMWLEHNNWITWQNYIFIWSLMIYETKVKKEEGRIKEQTQQKLQGLRQ